MHVVLDSFFHEINKLKNNAASKINYDLTPYEEYETVSLDLGWNMGLLICNPTAPSVSLC